MFKEFQNIIENKTHLFCGFPTNISGKNSSIIPTEGLRFALNNESGITLNAGNVSIWTDYISGIQAIQPTAASQPLYNSLIPDFDGSNDYLYLPQKTLNPYICGANKSFTFYFKAKLDVNNANQYFLTNFSSLGAATNGYLFRLLGTSGKLNCLFTHSLSPAINIQCNATTVLNTGQWYNIIYTFDSLQPAATKVNIYLDGIPEVVTTTVNGAFTQIVDAVAYPTIGGFCYDSGNASICANPYNGQIKTELFWDRILTPSEIAIISAL